MNLFAKLKTCFNLIPKIFLLSDVKPFLYARDVARIFLSLNLSAFTSAAKILGPAALAKSVEMIAKNETELQIVSELNLSPFELLIITGCLAAWVQQEGLIQKMLLNPVKHSLASQLSKKMLRYTHEISMQEHLEKRHEFTGAFLLIQNSCSQLPIDVISIVYPTILDLGLGLAVLGTHYGTMVTSGFILYSVVDLLILNAIVNFIFHSRAQFEKVNQLLSEFYQHIYETVVYEETIRSNNREKFETFYTDNSLGLLEQSSNKFNYNETIRAIVKNVPHFVLHILMVIYIYKDDIQLDQLDELLFLLSYFSIYASSLNRFDGGFTSCLSSVQSFNKLMSITHKTPSPTQQSDIKPEIEFETFLFQAVDFNVLNYPITIEFRNVSFGYTQTNYILDNISFIASPTKTLAIVGPSGVGKSTIAKLIYGLYTPDSGYIFFNGVNIRDIPIKTLRSLVSYMPQSTDLFRNESLKYNVLYGVGDDSILSGLKFPLHNSKRAKPKVDENQPLARCSSAENASQYSLQKSDKLYRKIMKQVELNDLVEREDAGEKLDPNNLSGGQKQRIGLARALIRNSPIFVTDEFSAALDSFAEKKLINLLSEKTKHKTSIQITHRLSTIKQAEKIVVLDQGKIAEMGTHDELMNNEALYFSYYRAQCYM